MIALLHQIPSEAKIVKTLRSLLYGKHMRCPSCQTRQVYASEKRYFCSKCRKHFSLLTGTWLSGTKLHLRTIWALLWCWTQKVPVLQTQKLCHVSEECARHWFRLFRAHLPMFEPILEGVVQMDEAYFRVIALLLAKQVDSRKLAMRMIPNPSVDKADAANFLFQYIAPHTTLHTDGATIYKTIEHWWPVEHKVDIHKKFEFGLTSEIEGMFGNLRTFIRRMYHHATSEQLPEYVGEFCVRFSHPEIFDSPLTYLQHCLKPVPFD